MDITKQQIMQNFIHTIHRGKFVITKIKMHFPTHILNGYL
jgi:hypothetical protein